MKPQQDKQIEKLVEEFDDCCYVKDKGEYSTAFPCVDDIRQALLKAKQIGVEEEREKVIEKIKQFSDSQEYETNAEYMTCEELFDVLLQSLTH